jgi:hypothetical protein
MAFTEKFTSPSDQRATARGALRRPSNVASQCETPNEKSALCVVLVLTRLAIAE